MTNAQLCLAYIIPTVLVLIGILMNRSDNQALRTEMRSDNQALRTEMRSDNQALRTEMVTLRNQIHQDMVVMLHERVATVESKRS